mgnify:FL=1
MLSCAAAGLPPDLWDQLAEEGVALLPEDTAWGGQRLVRLRRREGRALREELLAVAFVPLRNGA